MANRTYVNYEIPEKTCLVLLEANHLIDEGVFSESYSYETIYNYFFEENIKLYCDKKNKDYDFYYVVNKDGKGYPIYVDYKIVKKRIKKYVKAIIEYFKSCDLSHVNNDVLYEKNKQTKILKSD